MPPVISFIGWHNSGKTTLASQVVAMLKGRGYSVAVIKSTKENGIEIDQPQTDTATYWRVGPDSVTLLAPDQLIIRSKPPEIDLLTLANRYFFDMDIVIAEGFKRAAHVPKIEVRRGTDGPLLRDEVEGVVAIATDQPMADSICFRLDQIREIADFIEARLLTGGKSPTAQISLTINGGSISLPEPIRNQLAAAVQALLAPLHLPEHTGQGPGLGAMEFTIQYPQPSEKTH
jgi:molybdopterin-guanine dinucleotide biosynthesis protein B